MTITVEDVVATLQEIVAEFGADYVYKPPAEEEAYNADRWSASSCLYVHKDKDTGNPIPGCLVAQVLHRKGVSLLDLAPHEGKSFFDFYERFDIDGDAARLLTTAQGYQDDNVAWGDAVAQALGDNDQYEDDDDA